MRCSISLVASLATTALAMPFSQEAASEAAGVVPSNSRYQRPSPIHPASSVDLPRSDYQLAARSVGRPPKTRREESIDAKEDFYRAHEEISSLERRSISGTEPDDLPGPSEPNLVARQLDPSEDPPEQPETQALHRRAAAPEPVPQRRYNLDSTINRPVTNPDARINEPSHHTGNPLDIPPNDPNLRPGLPHIENQRYAMFRPTAQSKRPSRDDRNSNEDTRNNVRQEVDAEPAMINRKQIRPSPPRYTYRDPFTAAERQRLYGKKQWDHQTLRWVSERTSGDEDHGLGGGVVRGVFSAECQMDQRTGCRSKVNREKYKSNPHKCFLEVCRRPDDYAGKDRIAILP